MLSLGALPYKTSKNQSFSSVLKELKCFFLSSMTRKTLTKINDIFSLPLFLEFSSLMTTTTTTVMTAMTETSATTMATTWFRLNMVVQVVPYEAMDQKGPG